MGNDRGRVPRWSSRAVLALGGLMLLGWPDRAPVVVGLGLATAFGPMSRAGRNLRGTGLRGAWAWGLAALGLGLIAQGVAWGEPLATGRPGAGHWAYLSALATLAALMSVFNARRPGGGAWAMLMVVLVLVLLIPWLEGSGLARGSRGMGRLRLEAPWSLFFGLLALAGTGNFLPTRFGAASLLLLLGLGLEAAGLIGTSLPLEVRGRLWSAASWATASAVWAAEARARRPARARSELARLWFWFRDRWGVVWGLRVLERFNRAAETAGWPIRLGWSGVIAENGSALEVPEEAEATLKGLVRRFAEAGRLATVEVADDP